MKTYKVTYDDFELKTIIIMAKGKVKAIREFCEKYGRMNQILKVEEVE